MENTPLETLQPTPEFTFTREQRKQLLSEIQNKLEKVFKEKYKGEAHLAEAAIQVTDILKALKISKLEDITGKKILDLGCGHTVPKKIAPNIEKIKAMKVDGKSYEEIIDSLEHRVLSQFNIPLETMYEISRDDSFTFEPWTTRALHELGADVTGVDIGNLQSESFKHFDNVNLLDIDKFKDFLEEHSFDVVNLRLISGSPEFEKQCNSRGLQPNKAVEMISESSKSFIKTDGVLLNIGNNTEF